MTRGLGDDAVAIRLFTVCQLNNRDDLIPPPRAGPARHHHVVDSGMLGDRSLDLFGEDLLAAGIDSHRIAAQQLDFAIGIPAGPVAWHRMPDALDDRERPRRLVRITEIPQWYQALLSQPADFLVARRQDPGHVLAGHHRTRVRGEPAGGAEPATGNLAH